MIKHGQHSIIAASMHNFFEQFKAKRLCLVRDDQANPPRGIFVAPAQDVPYQVVNEVIQSSGGLFFVALSPARAAAFLLQRMTRGAATDSRAKETSLNCLVSVEAREGVTTGISAADRTATLQVLGQPEPNPRMLVKPGHIFPVEVNDGGVLVKNSLPEAALDIVRIANFSDAALFVDLLNSDGQLLNGLEIEKLSAGLQIPLANLSDLIRYRLETEKLVYKAAEAKLPTRLAGEVRSIIYKSLIHSGEHLVLVKGEIDPERATLTRVQAEFTFSDVFGGENPPSRKQLQASLKAIGEQGSGVLVYLRSPYQGRLAEQINSWETQYRSKPAVMMREYGLGAQILRDIGVRKIELLTSSTKNLVGLTTFGIDIVAQRPLSNTTQ